MRMAQNNVNGLWWGITFTVMSWRKKYSTARQLKLVGGSTNFVLIDCTPYYYYCLFIYLILNDAIIQQINSII